MIGEKSFRKEQNSSALSIYRVCVRELRGTSAVYVHKWLYNRCASCFKVKPFISLTRLWCHFEISMLVPYMKCELRTRDLWSEDRCLLHGQITVRLIILGRLVTSRRGVELPDKPRKQYRNWCYLRSLSILTPTHLPPEIKRPSRSLYNLAKELTITDHRTSELEAPILKRTSPNPGLDLFHSTCMLQSRYPVWF